MKKLMYFIKDHPVTAGMIALGFACGIYILVQAVVWLIG